MSGSRVHLRSAVVVLIAAITAVSPLRGQGFGNLLGPRQLALSEPVSPSVAVTFRGEKVEPGMERLLFAVMWRGRPGWFSARSATTVITPVGPNVQTMTALDALARTVTFNGPTVVVQGRTFDLQTANVLLFDNAGGQEAATFVRSFGVQAHMPSATGARGRLSALLALPEFREFLRCEERAAANLLPPTQNVCVATSGR